MHILNHKYSIESFTFDLQQLIKAIINNKVIKMREIRLKEIQNVCNSPAGLKIKRQVRGYVRSKPGFNPERKRPRNLEEAKILNSFTRK